VRRSALAVLAGLRRADERQRRAELAAALAATGAARAALGSPPAPTEVLGPVPQELFVARRSASHLEWAVWGERLGRAETAAAAEADARDAWKAASAGLRSVERLLARRAHMARTAAARRAQRDLDEVATTRWRRPQ
jgi:hypothetical protein